MRRLPEALRLLVLTLAVGTASAQEIQPSTLSTPVASAVPVPTESWQVTAITFAGNRITQERVLLRQLRFAVGQRVDVAQIEQGRQAIQNLGLFKRVKATSVPDGQGGVEVQYTVDERWYLLPYPRVDANADGEYAYGAQVRWDNLFGLNHTLRAGMLMRQMSSSGLGQQTQYSVDYRAPQILDSRWSIGGNASYSKQTIDNNLGVYEERIQNYQLLAGRTLGDGPPDEGWMVGGGLAWQVQDTNNGIGQYGEALAPVGLLAYRNLKLKIYSEEGVVFRSRAEISHKGFAADYNQFQTTASVIRYLPLGTTPHQTLHLIGEGGFNWDGPATVTNFGLGGANALRGYRHNFIEGNAYYRLAAEWARPIFRPWLRTVVIAEAGNVFARPSDFSFGQVHASVGLGLRMRITTFVDVQIEAGIALPVDGGSARFFAGKV